MYQRWPIELSARSPGSFLRSLERLLTDSLATSFGFSVALGAVFLMKQPGENNLADAQVAESTPAVIPCTTSRNVGSVRMRYSPALK